MDFGNGHAFTDRMFNAKGKCRNCKSRMIFSDAQRFARESGLSDNVVVCRACRHVFTYMLIAGSLTLDVDVTEKYPGIQTNDPGRDAANAAPNQASRKKWGFLQRIFGQPAGDNNADAAKDSGGN